MCQLTLYVAFSLKILLTSSSFSSFVSIVYLPLGIDFSSGESENYLEEYVCYSLRKSECIEQKDFTECNLSCIEVEFY